MFHPFSHLPIAQPYKFHFHFVTVKCWTTASIQVHLSNNFIQLSVHFSPSNMSTNFCHVSNFVSVCLQLPASHTNVYSYPLISTFFYTSTIFYFFPPSASNIWVYTEKRAIAFLPINLPTHLIKSSNLTLTRMGWNSPAERYLFGFNALLWRCSDLDKMWKNCILTGPQFFKFMTVNIFCRWHESCSLHAWSGLFYAFNSKFMQRDMPYDWLFINFTHNKSLYSLWTVVTVYNFRKACSQRHF